MIYLIASGDIHDYAFTAEKLKSATRIFAVDGGLVHCDKMGIEPHLIVGDFDSTPLELVKKYAHIPIRSFPIEKDETDLEIGLRLAFAEKTEKCVIFGALKQRIDHSLYNLHLLRRYPQRAFIETEHETIFAITGNATIETTPGQTISLLPLGGSIRGVTTKGLKWELHDAVMDKNFMSISNRVLHSSFDISIGSGDVICCLNH